LNTERPTINRALDGFRAAVGEGPGFLWLGRRRLRGWHCQGRNAQREPEASLSIKQGGMHGLNLVFHLR
jgi:hypothetical protein